jgi:hypothetical protein
MTSRLLSGPHRGLAIMLLIGSFDLLVPAAWMIPAWCGNIDALLEQAQAKAGVHATELCDDATFIRRLSLDLLGRVPTENEYLAFVAAPDRTRAVDRMLTSEEHPEFWSQLWTTMLIGRGQARYIERELLRSWLQQSLQDELPLNQMAFQLITASGVTSLHGPVNYVAASRSDPVMRLSRTFLSVQLDCAQCHDHPYDRWTNEDYVALQRFYALTRFREVSGGVAVSDEGPSQDSPLPVFLTGRRPHTSAWRQELGMMVVSSKPFSRAMVNRTWHWLTGRGIVDPVDGLSRENAAASAELLEELASDLRSESFHLRSLIRRICLSDAYQRKPPDVNATTENAAQQRELFAARNIRPLLPEQWIASVAIVLDQPVPSAAAIAQQASDWLGVTQQSSPAGDPFAWTANTQTLVRELADEIPAPVRDLESMFLATLARKPTKVERESAGGYNSRDIIFALVHGSEFMTND